MFNRVSTSVIVIVNLILFSTIRSGFLRISSRGFHVEMCTSRCGCLRFQAEGQEAVLAEEVYIEQPKRMARLHQEERDEDFYFHDLPREKGNVWSKFRKNREDEEEVKRKNIYLLL